jgi:hypothetical protein
MSLVIFDGTTYFVESSDYVLEQGERIVFKGSFDQCDREVERLMDLAYSREKRR